VLWGRLPCETDVPVLTVDDGAEVVVDTISHEGILEDQGRDPVTFFGRWGVEPDMVLADAVALAASDHPRDPRVDGPHVVTGPIAVRGAQPGDALRTTVVSLERRVPYGIISNRHGRGALPGELPVDGTTVSVFASVVQTPDGPQGRLPLAEGSDESVSFPLRPFLGIMGVAARGPVRPHSVPPGPFGGNIDINLLTVGSSLYLPVQAPGALAYFGDPHFAQGDGEVALTAMEAPLRARLRFEVVPQDQVVAEFGALAGPLGETAEFLVPTGLDADLDEAVRACVRAALALLQARYGMSTAHAYAYLSAATDFNISQVVDLVQGVHARVRKADFSGLRGGAR
jgi:acetamidase/formamidase